MKNLKADDFAAIIAFIALGLSIISIISNNRLANITKKAKFIDETRSFNDIMIQNPQLKKIYLSDNDPSLANLTNEELTMLKSYCYKYLNLLDSLCVHYSVLKKFKKRKRWLDKQITKESYFGNWCNFYSKRFKKGNYGHKLISDIIQENGITGDYGTQFVEFVNFLINKVKQKQTN